MKRNERQLRKERTRLELIQAAGELFGEKGIAATTTEDVARRASVAHGTVFAHFPTQEALLLAVVEDFGLRLARRLHKLVGSSADTAQALRAHLKGLQESEGLYSRLVAERQILPRQARTAVVMMQSSISVHICEIAERDMAAGKIRRMPAALLFNSWISLLHYYLSNRDLFAQKGSVLEQRGQELYLHWLSLIRT
jgi:AcrR family transcriptional regulator